MSSSPRKSAALFVEPLEARIAPTGLVAITDPNNAVGVTDPTYITYKTGTATGGLHFQPGSDYGVQGSDIYAIKLTGDGSQNPANPLLSNGDKLLIYNGVLGFNPNNPFLQAANGSLVAFFRDANGDGHVQNDELISISASKNAQINVNGTVHGDIIDNLSNAGTIKLDGPIKIKQNIAGINITGDITGNILAGGSVANLSIAGSVHGIFTGRAANGFIYYLGDPGVASGTLNVPLPQTDIAGPAISNVSVGSIGEQFHTGDGGQHAAGGAIQNITVQNDIDGYTILTGNGGGGDAAGPAGSGGALTGFLQRGVIDSTGGHSLISIGTGHGGFADSLKGGKGGIIDGVAIGYDVGFDFNLGSGTVSVDHLNDSVSIHSGDGGMGVRGGNGGATDGIHVVTSTADDGNAATSETQVLSGAGGASTDANTGKGGKGGDINSVEVFNVLVPVAATAGGAAAVVPGTTLVQAGNGGAVKAGGSINGVTFLGNHLTVNAGNGADGFNHGGNGGTVTGVTVTNLDNLFATQVTINAGSGGAGFNGNGGNGGNVDTVSMPDSRLEFLTINGGTHGNGGISTNGVGGSGGTVNNITANDSNDVVVSGTVTTAAPVAVRSGNGADGTFGGGSGGTLTNSQITGVNLAFNAGSGNGGSVTGGGSGDAGVGGAIVTLNLSNQPVQVNNVTDPVTGIVSVSTTIFGGNTATVTSGNGGNAADGTGGAGGDITALNLITDVNITPQPNLNSKPAGFVADNFTVTSGSGGSGATAVGKGGDLTSPVVRSVLGTASLHAGDAGGSGAVGGNGGTIERAVATGLGTISMIAGNGGAGGTGGSISDSGTNLVPVTVVDDLGNLSVRQTNNEGGLFVKAGNGSVGTATGAGGAVTNFGGYISSGGTTSIISGSGGSNGGKLTSAGGDVNGVQLFGVNDGIATGSTVNLDAGDAGTSAASKRGSGGGNVTQVAIYNVDTGTVVHHVAAGDGSAGKKSGGNGGSITQVRVGLATEAVDIGYRSGGHLFGYNPDQSGGLFAGAAGGSSQLAGTSGTVSDISAAAIASIVAGKSGALDSSRLANTVDFINLAGTTRTTANADGSFINFDQANLVGSVPNPAAVGATTFHAGSDGLIAALTLGNHLNFFPEAVLSQDGSGALVVGDRQQPNPNPVIIAFT